MYTYMCINIQTEYPDTEEKRIPTPRGFSQDITLIWSSIMLKINRESCLMNFRFPNVLSRFK